MKNEQRPSAPRIHDRFAVLTGYTDKRVEGPYYVVNLRRRNGEVVSVALGLSPIEDKKASCDWRVWRVGAWNHLHRRSESFSISHAEPWTEKHAATFRRQRRESRLRLRMQTLLLVGFAHFSDKQLDAMYESIAVVPAELKLALLRLEDANPRQKDALLRLGLIDRKGEGVSTVYSATQLGVAALARTP